MRLFTWASAYGNWPTQGTITAPPPQWLHSGVFSLRSHGVARPFREPALHFQIRYTGGRRSSLFPLFGRNRESPTDSRCSDAQPGKRPRSDVTAGTLIQILPELLDYAFPLLQRSVPDFGYASGCRRACPARRGAGSNRQRIYQVVSVQQWRLFFDTFNEPCKIGNQS